MSILLSNAIKFTRDGTILVKAKTNKGGKEANLDEVIVTVKDTGTGIDLKYFQGYVQCLSQSQMKILA